MDITFKVFDPRQLRDVGVRVVPTGQEREGEFGVEVTAAGGEALVLLPHKHQH